MADLNDLKRYSQTDEEKLALLSDLRSQAKRRKVLRSINFSYVPDASKDYAEETSDYGYEKFAKIRLEKPKRYYSKLPKSKYCPKCGREFSDSKISCPDCMVKLKRIDDRVDVRYIESKPEFEFPGSRVFESFDEIFTDENLKRICQFDFSINDYYEIIRSIKAESFKNLEGMLNANGIELDDLPIVDKVMLYAKSFVEVDFKAYGPTLGYFEYNRIRIDDRQRKSLQITTVLHELTHFLVKEILTRTLCRILDATKNEFVESFITFILSHIPLCRLFDEYAAHTVEGRFTVFGYQDYSSFVSLQKEMPQEDIEIAKMIGNSFSISAKDILESFLDFDLREEIKEQFMADTIEDPDYSKLAFESCKSLTDDGMMQAIGLILLDGFENHDTELLERYREQFQ